MPSTNTGLFRSEHPRVLADPVRVRHIRNTAIVSRDVAGETIVVPICRGAGDLESVYMFNPLGRELWVLLAEGRTSEELANWITAHYQVEAEQAFADVHNYLAELREVGLIHTI
jgi:coenzyme PQQ synthesis protein D (PqqD)